MRKRKVKTRTIWYDMLMRRYLCFQIMPRVGDFVRQNATIYFYGGKSKNQTNFIIYKISIIGVQITCY